MTTVQTVQDRMLMAHLLRRAGFGATPRELDAAMVKGYDTVVDELLSPDHADSVPEDLIRRFHKDQ